jgi:hypothetical protein
VIYPGSTPVGNATLVVANVLTCNKHSQNITRLPCTQKRRAQQASHLVGASKALCGEMFNNLEPSAHVGTDAAGSRITHMPCPPVRATCLCLELCSQVCLLLL